VLAVVAAAAALTAELDASEALADAVAAEPAAAVALLAASRAFWLAVAAEVEIDWA
jgi:hypothetical protein